MPRASKKVKKPRSRPQIPIDWNFVDERLEADCSGVEIAGMLGIHRDTLYDRILQEKGVIFSDYALSKKGKGDGDLKYAQHKSALKGNTTLLIHLGKCRLKQKEFSEENKVDDELLRKYNEFMNSLADLQSSAKMEKMRESAE